MGVISRSNQFWVLILISIGIWLVKKNNNIDLFPSQIAWCLKHYFIRRMSKELCQKQHYKHLGNPRIQSLSEFSFDSIPVCFFIVFHGFPELPLLWLIQWTYFWKMSCLHFWILTLAFHHVLIPLSVILALYLIYFSSHLLLFFSSCTLRPAFLFSIFNIYENGWIFKSLWCHWAHHSHSYNVKKYKITPMYFALGAPET